jgi:hypothetical protein
MCIITKHAKITIFIISNQTWLKKYQGLGCSSVLEHLHSIPQGPGLKKRQKKIKFRGSWGVICLFVYLLIFVGGDWIQAFVYVGQVFYHWATSLALYRLFLKINMKVK